MNFQTMYNEKLTSAEDAVKVVNSGDWVDYGWCTGTPVALDAAMAKRLPELTDVNFRGGILMHVPEIFKIDSPAQHMTWNSWHMGGIERKAIAQNFSDPLLRAAALLPRLRYPFPCSNVSGSSNGQTRLFQFWTKRLSYGCCL